MDAGGSAATDRWAIGVERRSCPTSRIQGRQDTAADPGQVCCNRSGCSSGVAVLVDLDVRRGGRGKATAAAVGCKQEAVVTHGSSRCGRGFRDGVVVAVVAAAVAACDAKASVMADRCTSPAVDVSPRGLFRPSHVLVNRKSICTDGQQDHAYRSPRGLTARSQAYDSKKYHLSDNSILSRQTTVSGPTRRFEVEGVGSTRATFRHKSIRQRNVTVGTCNLNLHGKARPFI